jgi:serine/threonine-protein kinase RsbT
MQGGYSTARSMGLGLSGSRRLVDEFDVSTEVGRGTVVTFVKWGRR